MPIPGKPKPLEFDWDRHNRDKNWLKHQVSFRECEEVFSNHPINFLRDKKHSQKEDRFIALGVTNHQRKLFVTFTIRKNKIRVISARDQSKKERKLNEKRA